MRGILTTLGDSLTNFVANIGTSRDKATHSHYGIPLLTDDQLINAWRGAWLPAKIVNAPADDATRRWRAWQANSPQIQAIEAEEKRLGLRGKVREALRMARLLGGAAIYLSTGDRDAEKPLNPQRVGKGGLKLLNVTTRLDLTAGEVDRNPDSPYFGRPAFYIMQSEGRQLKIHPSRLVIFNGVEVPGSLGNRVVRTPTAGGATGWGDSILLAVMQACTHADSAVANVASLTFEANVDVFRIPNLMAELAGNKRYESDLIKRFQLAATLKGTNGALVLDKDEEYERKTISFANLPEVLDRFLQIVSGAADIPATRLLGQSPAGLSATGESDTRNYYDRLQAMQELDVAPAMVVLDECLIRSALGERPVEIHYTWNSLWQPTAKERADIGKTVADTIKTLADTKLFPAEALSVAGENTLTELGVMPGLESAMKKYAEATPDPAAEPDTTPPVDERQQVGDSAPQPLYVQRKVVNTGEILAWAKSQGFTAPLDAADLHVTVAYSRKPVDWMKVGTGSDWNENELGQLRIAPGGARVVEPLGGEGAVVLMFNSSALAYRHEAIREAGASWDYEGYQPHITITYDPGTVDLAKVAPYRGAIVLGPEIFEPLNTEWSPSA